MSSAAVNVPDVVTGEPVTVKIPGNDSPTEVTLPPVVISTSPTSPLIDVTTDVVPVAARTTSKIFEIELFATASIIIVLLVKDDAAAQILESVNDKYTPVEY